MIGARASWRESVWFVGRLALHVALGGRVDVWYLDENRVLIEACER